MLSIVLEAPKLTLACSALPIMGHQAESSVLGCVVDRAEPRELRSFFLLLSASFCALSFMVNVVYFYTTRAST